MASLATAGLTFVMLAGACKTMSPTLNYWPPALAYSVLTPGEFSFNPVLIDVLNDHLDTNDKPFCQTFPYLATAYSL